MAVAPTLRSVQALYGKLEREAYRAFHHRKVVHKADHFYNFCVTAHSMRDYYIECVSATASETSSFHRMWSQEPLIAAVADIANSAKHFMLRDSTRHPRSPRLKGVRRSRSGVFDVYQTSDGELLTNVESRPDLVVTLLDGSRYELYSFVFRVLEYWRLFLRTRGIKVRRQSLSQLSGA